MVLCLLLELRLNRPKLPFYSILIRQPYETPHGGMAIDASRYISMINHVNQTRHSSPRLCGRPRPTISMPCHIQRENNDTHEAKIQSEKNRFDLSLVSLRAVLVVIRLVCRMMLFIRPSAFYGPLDVRPKPSRRW